VWRVTAPRWAKIAKLAITRTKGGSASAALDRGCDIEHSGQETSSFELVSQVRTHPDDSTPRDGGLFKVNYLAFPKPAGFQNGIVHPYGVTGVVVTEKSGGSYKTFRNLANAYQGSW
jgi:hypothetical protein